MVSQAAHPARPCLIELVAEPGSCSNIDGAMTKSLYHEPMQKLVQKKTACTRDCPDACGLLVTIDNGRVVRLQGDPDHPITQGFICQRTSRFLDRQYSRHRLQKPLWRRNKGDDFEKIEWEQALDLLAEKMARYRDESGAASILQYRCGGSLGIMKHVGDHFFERFGPVTVKRGDVCAGAGAAAQMKDFGVCDSSDYFDFHNARTIFLWGKNVFVSNIHLIPELKKAQVNGTRIVLIDPVYHQTASIADQFVQPRPGTDSAIALGIAHWLFTDERIDPAVDEYCDHLPQFRSLALSRSLGEWAAVADITEVDLLALAKAYADGPTCSMIGWGLQRRRHGAATIRTIDALAAVSGSLGIKGGGASFYSIRRDAFDFSFANRNAAPRTFAEPLLGEEIINASDPPIRMAYVWGANPVVMLPDSQTIADALRTRDFTVVVDPFLTDTAQCADLVLPTTTMLEEDDLVGSYGHHYLAEVHAVVEPPEGVLSDHGIFCELSHRLGIADGFDLDAIDWKQRLLQKLSTAGVQPADFDAGFVKNPFVSDVLFSDRKFNTPSGKVNLIHELPAEMLAVHSDGRPRVTAVSTGKSQASQWPVESQNGPADAVVHPSIAPGCDEGDIVTLTTELSALQVRLRFSEKQREDVILLEKGGWQSAGRNANSLIQAEVTDDGECAVYYDTPAIIAAHKPQGTAQRGLK